MKLFLTIAGSCILGGLAAVSLSAAILQLAIEYFRLASKTTIAIAGF